MTRAESIRTFADEPVETVEIQGASNSGPLTVEQFTFAYAVLLTAIARRLAGVSAIKCDSEHSQVGGRRAHRLGAFEVLSQSGGLV